MLQESNYGNSEKGEGTEEPIPTENVVNSSASSASKSTETTKAIKKKTPQKSSPKKSNVVSKTQKSTKNTPTASTTKSTHKTSNSNGTNNSKNTSPKGDAKGNSALANILGGKGKSKSNGQGNDGTRGNIGSPKGNSSTGSGIGENWKTRIPEPQTHQCSTSGIVIVDIVVNANGSIKRATPRATKDPCLSNKAKQLVLKYVTAKSGSDGRRGTYRVNLK